MKYFGQVIKKVIGKGVVRSIFILAILLPALPGCSSSTEINSSSPDTSEDAEYSEDDIYKCESFLTSNTYLEQQAGQDTWTTSVGIVRAGYDKRIEAWEMVIGSANYEVSELTYADDWSISSTADDFESAYQDGLDVVSNSTDATEIEEVLINVLDAFESLNSACTYVVG
jgi:hypothetical protein